MGSEQTGIAGLAARVFPGARPVWVAAAVVLAVFTVLGVRMLGATTASLTGTNSVGVGAVIADAKPGEKACIRDLVVPRGTGQIGIWLFGQRIQPGARVTAWIETSRGRRTMLASPPVTSAADFSYFRVAKPLESKLIDASVCLVPDGATLSLGGAAVQRLPDSEVSSVGDRRLDGLDVAVRFNLPYGKSKRFASVLTDALDRSTVFEPWVGRLLTWLALPALLLLLYFVARVSATADRRTVRWLAAAACGVALVHGAAWAVLLHPLHGADESEHFAYAQHLAASNSRPDDAATSQKPPYASAEERLMAALHHNSTILNTSSRPRWDSYWETRLRADLRSTSTSDGGGFTESGTGHGPLYYSVIGVPLRVLDEPSQQPAALLAMRLLNALLASLVAGCAVLVAYLVVPRRQDIAWLAGIVAGLQPVFGSVAGAVNNDTAVNAAAALMILLLVQSFVLGPTVRRGVWVGLLAVVLPLSKITGFELLPVAALAGAGLAVQFGWRAGLRWAAAAVGTSLAMLAVWVFILSPLLGSGRGDFVYRHPPVPAAAGAPAAPAPMLPTAREKLEYVVQTFIPNAPVGADRWQLPGSTSLERWPAFKIYIDRGYGLFGWKSADLSIGVLRGILAVLAGAWLLAVLACVRRRHTWRQWAGPASVLVATVGSVLLFISWAYATNEVRTDAGEQGRYLFPALVPLSVLVSAGALAFRGGTWARIYVGAGTVAAAGLAVLAWTTALRGWFT